MSCVRQRSILNFNDDRPLLNFTFNIFNPIGIKYILRAEVVVSDLRTHKLKTSFQASINPICGSGNDAEFKIRNLYKKFLHNTDSSLSLILFFRNSTFKLNENTEISNLMINYFNIICLFI